MVDGASKGFEQAYNAQAVVDDGCQLIVAAEVTQQANDKLQLVPMLNKTRENMGQAPTKVSSDAGYFSDANVKHPDLSGIDLYIPPDRQKHGTPLPEPTGDDADLNAADRMRRKLATPEGHAVYARRKTIVEPVFGQIKQAMGFRRFSFRGLENVSEEWKLVCTAHNLLKIFRSGRMLGMQAA